MEIIVLPAQHSGATGHVTGTAVLSTSQSQLAGSAHTLPNDRTSNFSMSDVVPTAQAAVSVQQVQTGAAQQSPFSMNTVADALVRVAPASALKWTRLSKAHQGAILGALPRWARTVSFDAMAKNIPKQGTKQSQEWADFQIWLFAHFRSLLPSKNALETLDAKSLGRDIAFFQLCTPSQEPFDPVEMLEALSFQFGRLVLPEEGFGLIPMPHPSHADATGHLRSLAIRVLPDHALPQYLDAADAAYGPQGELPATQQLQGEKDEHASRFAYRLLVDAARANKPLAVISLLKRNPPMLAVTTALDVACDRIRDNLSTERNSVCAILKTLDILKLLMARLSGENLSGMYMTRLGELPQLMLRLNVPEDGRVPIRYRQLDLVTLFKTTVARSRTQTPNIDFGQFKSDFIRAANPGAEQNPRVSTLNNAILRELS
jgi:hypothetical protein